ncbi:gamma-glutamyl-gamma-aminobutyrate hydrolase family protein [Pseudonocardia kunmingensis]|uniref:Anthranilate synthase component 2/putative glutamine amidotransferase n=1 Tax=Pseudonocardia kunmingensis TaxID=630975 RepID=A0A543D1K3_9PSEU|nr:gamma-glutamyl-gamma-aminobutyrate hydrolase family protein [Pseudonocardia kunmingensis]TQM03215.1 anthranilate synthase component 2/putative glutamine amidotransferase [Pseudonocardia kunmingensis]
MGSNGSDGTAHPRPLIGLTAYGERAAYGVWDHDAVLLPRTYGDVVVAAGGVPVLLPPVPEAAAAVDRLDAVVLCGGPDVDPGRYGAAPHPRAGAPRPERDAAEAAVLRRALERDMPVLGVCRGAQLLNVELGGTLLQHVPDAVGHPGHNPSPGVFGTVAVELEPGSRVAAAVGPAVSVLCHHHQALDRVADGLVVTGRAGDGTVEAVELDGHPFVVGVQWHPEQDATDVRLMAALVHAAQVRAESTV